MSLLLAAVVSAVLMWAAFPPLNVGALVFVAPAPLLWALRKAERPGEASWLGFVFGAIFFGATLRWIALLGIVAWLPLSIAEGAYGALFGIGMWTFRKLPPTKWWLATVGLWALWEFARERWPFGGFPWGALGNGVGTLAWPRGATQWIGTTGWSVVAIAVAATIALIADDERVRTLADRFPAVVHALDISTERRRTRDDGVHHAGDLHVHPELGGSVDF